MKSFKLFLFTLFTLIFANRLSGIEYLSKTDTVIILSEINILENNKIKAQKSSTGSINRLSATEIENFASVNPANYLNTIPGVQLQSGTLSTNRLTIRGIGSRTPYNTNRINLFLLNIPIASNDGVSAPEEILGLQNLDVSVQKGPSSALMGSGLGGTVKITPSFLSDKKSSLKTAYGSFSTKQISLGHRNQNKIFIAANYLNSDGYRENNEYQRGQLLAIGNIDLERIKLQPIIYFIKGTAKIPSSLNINDFEYSPTKAAANWLAIEGYEASTKVITGVNIEHKLSNQLKGLATIYSKFYDGYEKRPFNSIDDQLNSIGGSYQLNYSGEIIQTITLARGSSENYSWSILKDEILENEFVQNLGYFGLSNISYLQISDQLNLSVANALNIHNYQYKNLANSNFKEKKFPLIYSPRIGVNYALSKNSLWASVGHGYSNPSPEETLYPDGEINARLKQETGWQYEIGHHFANSRNTFSIETAIYYFILNNLILTKRLTEDQFMGINAGETLHYGLENTMSWLVFEQQSFPGTLHLKSNASLSKNIFLNFKNDGITYNGNDLPAIPNYQFSFQVNWLPTELISVNLNNTNIGDQYLNDSNTLKTNSYSKLDLNSRKQFRLYNEKLLEVKFAVNNLLNKNYAAMIIPNAVSFNGNLPRFYYPGTPRYWNLSMKLLF